MEEDSKKLSEDIKEAIAANKAEAVDDDKTEAEAYTEEELADAEADTEVLELTDADADTEGLEMVDMDQENPRHANKQGTGGKSPSKRFRGLGKKANKRVLLPVAGVAAALAAAYVGISVYCGNHFYLGSTVNGVSANGASVERVKENIEQTAASYQMTIYDADGQTDTITAEQVGLVCNPDDTVISGMLDGQNGFLWPKYLIEGKNYESYELISVDADKVKKLVPTLNCVKNSGKKESENATCVYSDSDNAFVIVDEVCGDTIVQDEFAARLVDEITNMKEELHLDTDKCYQSPQYTADSQEVKDFCDELNKAIDIDITYDLTETKETVSKATKAGWITVKDDLTYEYNTEAMTEFIEAMGNKYNTYGKDKNLHTSYGVDVVVKGKNYGWKIDTEGELTQLKADLEAGKDVSRDFVYSSTANSHGANDYGDTYVEINLTAQHLFMYKNGNLVIETDFVSGNPSKGNATPVGACQVTYTTRNATLRGANYASFVNYWMPFNGNVGLHDATWRSEFGGTIYKKSGSHGCVNLPLAAAKTIYENLSKGDCILVYTLDGTENSSTSKDTSGSSSATQSASDVPEVSNDTQTQQNYTPAWGDGTGTTNNQSTGNTGTGDTGSGTNAGTGDTGSGTNAGSGDAGSGTNAGSGDSGSGANAGTGDSGSGANSGSGDAGSGANSGSGDSGSGANSGSGDAGSGANAGSGEP